MKHKTAWLASIVVLVVAMLACLNYFTPTDASPEWVYTLEWINIILTVLISPAAAILIIDAIRALKHQIRHKNMLAGLCFLLCSICIAIPSLAPDFYRINWHWQYVFSVCWLMAFLLAGLFLFLIASRVNSAAAMLLCLAGSIFLGLAAMESYLLFTDQPGDGMTAASAKSKHRLQIPGVPEYENWSETICGYKPGPGADPLPSFHREASFDNIIFDVQYTFDDKGWRKRPTANPDAENDLLLFGCSYAFGFGLEDEQTWAWQLANALGPNWRLENYSANGYSANHMLCMLEHELIKTPQGQNRYALFLALDQHLRRNEFFSNTPHYELTSNGEANAGGKAKFQWIHNLAHSFNGSQLAREASAFITSLIMRWREKPLALYLAMLKKSAQILATKYKTKLIVLIWPGFEELAPGLEKMGITTLMAETMLSEWKSPEDPGWKYRIHRVFDYHPNNLAAAELATELGRYFQNLIQSRPQQENIND